MVNLVEIDVVRAEAAERAFDGVQDVLARRPPIPGPRARGPGALGGHDEVVSPPLQPAPEYRLGTPDRLERAAERIHVGGVEEGDAASGRAVQDGERGGLVTLEPEGHGAETEPGDAEPGTAEPEMGHGSRE